MGDEDFRARLQVSLGHAYTIERELGGGGMSRVFVATENALARQVVIKVLPPDMAQGVSTQRFTREVRLAAQLQHPHIVPLLTSGETEGLPWYTMPFVQGESLRTKLARGGELPIADAVRILREVASALAYAHGHGVVHRDIKPDNVLLSEGTAMVSDFGVAKALVEAGEAGGTGLTSRGVALGTPAYMAPEQGMADPRTDQRADVYAFGVMAYEMLAGRTPFTGRSPQATLAAHVTEVPESVERVRSSTPPALASLIMRCLAKSPADRPQHALELVHALDALVTPTAGIAPHAAARLGAAAEWGGPTPREATGVEARPSARRLGGALAVAATLLLVAAGGWFAWMRLREPVLADRRIAVAPFKNETGDSSFNVVGRMAADVLTRALSGDDSVDVVSNAAVMAAMTDMPPGADVVKHLARLTRASVVVWGTIYAQGDSLRLQMSVTDMRTGKPLRMLDPVAALRSDPTVAIEFLRDRLLGTFEIDKFGQVMTRTPKISAYREYEAATEVFGRADWAAARPILQRAIKLDSTFYIAYFWLAAAYSNASMWDSSEVVTAQWARFQDRFTPYERESFEFRRAALTGNNEWILAAAQRLAARDSSLPVYYTGIFANHTLRARLALESMLIVDSATWANGLAVNFRVFHLADAYHLNSDNAAELAMLRRRRPEYLSEPRLFARDLRALAALSRRAEASALADTLLRGTTDPNNAVITDAVNQAAMEFEAHGDSAAGSALARQVTEWHSTHPTNTPSTVRHMQQGIAWLLNGTLDSARQAFTRAARDTSAGVRRLLADVAASGYLGVTLARRGEVAPARALADSLGALQRKWLFGWNTFWKGAIYSELGEREAGVRLLGQAYEEGIGKRQWHYYNQLRALRGYAPFEARIKPQ